MDISGSGARYSATITIKIFDSDEIKISELNITAKSNGELSNNLANSSRYRKWRV